MALRMIGAELGDELVGDVADMHPRTARDEKIADGTTYSRRSRSDQDTQILLQGKRIYVPVHCTPNWFTRAPPLPARDYASIPCSLPAACAKSQDGVSLAVITQAGYSGTSALRGSGGPGCDQSHDADTAADYVRRSVRSGGRARCSAPYQIRTADMASPAIKATVAQNGRRVALTT
jgi:hypothetical protein